MKTIKQVLLAMALVAASAAADAAPKKAKATETVLPPPIVDDTPMADESIGARLVVDPAVESGTTAAATSGAASEASIPLNQPKPNLEAAANPEKPAAPIEKSPAEVAKLPENQIPVLAGKKEVKKSGSDNLSRLLTTLGVLVLLLGASLFGLKRWSASRGKKNQSTKIQVLTQHALGPKKSLAIIQVAGEAILIGVTDQNISMLKTIALIDDEFPEAMPRNFGTALEDYGDEDLMPTAQRDAFAVRGLNEIRDTVSMRTKNFRG